MLGRSWSEVLGRCAVTAGLDQASLERLQGYLAVVEVATGASVVREGDLDRALFLVLDGAAEVLRGQGPVQRLEAGASFGGLGLLTGRLHRELVRACTPLSLARLDEAAWRRLRDADPALALTLAVGLATQLDDAAHPAAAASVTKGRRLPRAKEVVVQLPDGPRTVLTGTPAHVILPRLVDGVPTVAALMNQKPVSLTTPVLTQVALEPLLLSHWEGRQVFARSTALALLEAAWDLDPALTLFLGPSRGIHQLVEVPGFPVERLPWLASELTRRLEDLAAQARHVRVEHWLVDEARAHFSARGWDNAARLLGTARTATVPLTTCGQVYALALGPMVPDTSLLGGASLRVHGEALALELGALDPRRRGVAVQVRMDPPMIVEHRRWTQALGVTGVGAFNERCIDGQVSQLIRVAEGFHEKQISRLADTIAAARERLRVICVAGPSSSGKTTFLKRLSVQLHINGLRPVAVSLDDYYVDRVKTPRDEHGEWDFEALEALDLPLLQAQVRRLLAGEEVKLARYDFKTGLSSPEGGPRLRLSEGDLLLLEGIHGLNPALLGEIGPADQRFRIFIHPATSLAFDRLSRVSTTDLRLLRRIVRDRHTRGYSAAENIARWPSVQAGEQKHIFPFQDQADATFDSALVYEPAVLKVFAERYLLEVPPTHPSFATAWRLRHLVDQFVAIYPDHVPPTSLMREFIGGSGFEY